jgi:prophage regulatory protein
MTEQILYLPEVGHATGLSRSTIYKAMTENAFLKPIRIGKRAVGWRQADITNWLETHPQATMTITKKCFSAPEVYHVQRNGINTL